MANRYRKRWYFILCILALTYVALRAISAIFFARRSQSPEPDLQGSQPDSVALQKTHPASTSPTVAPQPHEIVASTTPKFVRPPLQRRSKPGAESVLLAVEIGAVVLFVIAGAMLFQTRRQLNDAYGALQQADPRLLPTIVAAANPGILPETLVDSGQNGNSRPAPAIPTPFPTAVAAPVIETSLASISQGIDGDEHALRKAANPSTDQNENIEWGTTVVMQKRVSDRDQPRRLNIPAIGVDSFVFPDYGEDWLKLGVVQIAEAVAPGEAGNIVLAAHNDIYGEIFRDLDQLQAGDELLLSGDNQTYTYRVRETLIVEPEDIWVTLPTSTPTITLVSCYPYLLGTQRIVVFGDLLQ